jgi:hypothetical protein
MDAFKSLKSKFGAEDKKEETDDKKYYKYIDTHNILIDKTIMKKITHYKDRLRPWMPLEGCLTII